MLRPDCRLDLFYKPTSLLLVYGSIDSRPYRFFLPLPPRTRRRLTCDFHPLPPPSRPSTTFPPSLQGPSTIFLGLRVNGFSRSWRGLTEGVVRYRGIRRDRRLDMSFPKNSNPPPQQVVTLTEYAEWGLRLDNRVYYERKREWTRPNLYPCCK